MKDDRQVKINREWCKGCSICVAFCTKSVLDLDKEGKASWSHPEDCIRCGFLGVDNTFTDSEYQNRFPVGGIKGENCGFPVGS